MTRILAGDARERLRDLRAESVHCAVTSPPYFGLRAYHGDPGMIGLEPTLDEHIANLVAVFREVRRVLRRDGTLWLNYGDAYAAQGTGAQGGSGQMADRAVQHARGNSHRRPTAPVKPKDLMLLPARVALALQADGWWVRSEVVWHKPNPMPESVTDRPTSSHEKLFLLSKSATYFYDADAVRLPPTGRTDAMRFGVPPDRQDGDRVFRADGTVGANIRNVWTIPTHSFSEAHFATFPPALVEPCIRAGTSDRGVCGACGAPWVRVVERQVRGVNPRAARQRLEAAAGALSGGTEQSTLGGFQADHVSTGWRPSCECAADTVPATCLDPFGGAGTVALVAERLQRDAVLIEISPEYAAMAEKRIRDDAPLLAQVQVT